MEKWERDLYRKLTDEHDESGETARLNYQLFGDNEWSGVDRAATLERMRDEMEADSWGHFG